MPPNLNKPEPVRAYRDWLGKVAALDGERAGLDAKAKDIDREIESLLATGSHEDRAAAARFAELQFAKQTLPNSVARLDAQRETLAHELRLAESALRCELDQLSRKHRAAIEANVRTALASLLDGEALPRVLPLAVRLCRATQKLDALVGAPNLPPAMLQSGEQLLACHAQLCEFKV